MPMQTLSVKLLSCKILKMKYCVPFEVQYYSKSNVYGRQVSLVNNSDLDCRSTDVIYVLS